MYECAVTKEQLEWIYSAINQASAEVTQGQTQSPYPLILNKYHVLFHKIPRQINRAQMRDIDDTLLILKHLIYRMRLRSSSDRRPARWGVTLQCFSRVGKTHLKALNMSNKSCIEPEV